MDFQHIESLDVARFKELSRNAYPVGTLKTQHVPGWMHEQELFETNKTYPNLSVLTEKGKKLHNFLFDHPGTGKGALIATFIVEAMAFAEEQQG